MLTVQEPCKYQLLTNLGPTTASKHKSAREHSRTFEASSKLFL